MTQSTDHSTDLLEDLIAEDIGRQIDAIAESLQREGWPMPWSSDSCTARWKPCRNEFLTAESTFSPISTAVRRQTMRLNTGCFDVVRHQQ